MKAKNEMQQIDQLIAETTKAIIQWQTKKVMNLFRKTEKLFDKGNDYTRSLISNKFIFPITHLLEMNYSWGREYLALLPNHLKTEYQRQIYSSGI
jgi:hypothetical protein